MSELNQSDQWQGVDPNGMPRSKDERHLRRLLAMRTGMQLTYYDDGEAQWEEHGIRIDFMRESVADIDAKLRELNLVRAEKIIATLTS